ncbi:hypothetical protein CORC01_03490 [Colletotrichum orchidophilum]|uniref:tRNA (guanine(9)-N1)-methyltransferase n=1 Tax=Colletotrichum orchidophilum TaxID=1209926 RepID=A0A1G4BIP4_9PEZI|nr:uncharacterized protein CORC01_03490 [Colletotrichum orchidophilum]OHF01176.1 hypothetical protein CORC01_03490 [Colletotrichum orchidophilum]
MDTSVSEPVNQPAKVLTMAEDGPENVAVASSAANGDVEGGAPAAEEKEGEEADVESSAPGTAEEPKISKNQLRKMKRKAAWEDGREDRKRKRKDKRHDRQVARREELAAAVAEAEAKGLDPASVTIPPRRKTPRVPPTQVPITLILDCAFEKYMLEKEQVSLASQITRSYSDNRQSRYRAHLYVSSYGGQLKERFEGTLGSQHVHWKGVKLVEGDFVAAAKDADELMSGPRGGKIIDLLQPAEGGDGTAAKKPAVFRDILDDAPSPDPEPEPADELKNIVYLSSDSVNTLDRLEPNTSYVIGGLVDRNREKGLCHRRAREMGIRTAKLPIGEYMNLSSRRVLATNHVVEIMLNWLETGSWAEAFLKIIPKRKEAKLKEDGTGSAGGTPVAQGEGEVEDSRFEEENDEDVDEKQTITDNVAASVSTEAAQESVKDEVSTS